jgi:hypothetical protein
VTVVAAFILAAPLFLIFFGELISARIRARKEDQP